MVKYVGRCRGGLDDGSRTKYALYGADNVQRVRTVSRVRSIDRVIGPSEAIGNHTAPEN